MLQRGEGLLPGPARRCSVPMDRAARANRNPLLPAGGEWNCVEQRNSIRQGLARAARVGELAGLWFVVPPGFLCTSVSGETRLFIANVMGKLVQICCGQNQTWGEIVVWFIACDLLLLLRHLLSEVVCRRRGCFASDLCRHVHQVEHLRVAMLHLHYALLLLQGVQIVQSWYR